MTNIFCAYFAVLLWKNTFAAAPTEVLFLIYSQQSSYYHRQLSVNLRNDILQQSRTLTTDYNVNVRMSYEIFNQPGDWTLLPTFAHLQGPQFTPSLINNNTKWIIICEEHTEIKVQLLLAKLSFENHSEPLFLGYPLFDREATIIHHFAFFENPKWFPYPMLRAGVILSVSLFKSLAAVITGQGIASGTRPPTRTTEFSIDAAHELARFILDNIHIQHKTHLEDADNNINVVDFDIDVTEAYHKQRNFGENTLPPTPLKTTEDPNRLKNVRKMILRRTSYICPKANSKSQINFNNSNKMHGRNSSGACAMYAKPMETNVTSCLFPIKSKQIFVAIKTCQKFHKERIPIIEATWAPYAFHMRYYSDISDTGIPTISTGVPNAETGHCEKTLAILKLALKDIKQMNREMLTLKADNATIQWLLICDDDTLLSISRLCDFLGCFNHTDMVYLGERYGYRLHAKDGFNYITGGGGIVLSLPTVSLIVKHCSCPTATSPDDMILGACLHTLGIKAIHSSKFHQARPNDYPRELLELEQPISFHKFWQLDPFHVYERWFGEADRQIFKSELFSKRNEHSNKLIAHLKNSPKLSNGIPYTVNSDSYCENNRVSESITAPIDTRNDVSLAAFEHESSSHLDL